MSEFQELHPRNYNLLLSKAMSYVYRCPSCRTRRKSYRLLQEHISKTGHSLCRCRGYHFAHREGSKFCFSNPLSFIYLCDRYKSDQGDISRSAISAIEAGASLEDVKDVLLSLGYQDLSNDIRDPFQEAQCSQINHSIMPRSES